MRQAAPTPDDYKHVDRLCTLMQCLSLRDRPYFPKPGNEEDDAKPLSTEDAEAKLGDKVAEWWRMHSGSWNRVYYAGKMAFKAACDPQSDVVQWKPQYKAAIERIDAENAKAGGECPMVHCPGTVTEALACDHCDWKKRDTAAAALAAEPIPPEAVDFKLYKFNPLRAGRGAPAAKVEVTLDGETSYPWMDRKDIEEDIELFGEHPGLIAARDAYAANAWFPPRDEVPQGPKAA